MARKRRTFLQKVRTREHIVGDLAVNHVERQVLLSGYTVEQVTSDYGLDLAIFTYDADGQLEDGLICLQVKGTEHLERLKVTDDITFRADRSDIRTWLRRSLPVILIVYDVTGDTAYWLYVQRYFGRIPGFEIDDAPKTVTLRLPHTQTLTVAAVGEFALYRNNVLGQFGRIDHG